MEPGQCEHENLTKGKVQYILLENPWQEQTPERQRDICLEKLADGSCYTN